MVQLPVQGISQGYFVNLLCSWDLEAELSGLVGGLFYGLAGESLADTPRFANGAVLTSVHG